MLNRVQHDELCYFVLDRFCHCGLDTIRHCGLDPQSKILNQVQDDEINRLSRFLRRLPHETQLYDFYGYKNEMTKIA